MPGGSKGDQQGDHENGARIRQVHEPNYENELVVPVLARSFLYR